MKGESDRGEREEGMVWSEAGLSLWRGEGRPWWVLLAGHCHPWVGGRRS